MLKCQNFIFSQYEGQFYVSVWDLVNVAPQLYSPVTGSSFQLYIWLLRQTLAGKKKKQHVCQSLTEKPMWISLNKGRQWSGYKGRNSKEMEKKMLRKGLCTKINLLWGSKALMIKLRADELRGKNSGLWEYAKVKRLEIRHVSFKFLQILEIFA